MQRNTVALAAYIDARATWRFGYGPDPLTHDCARFCGGGVEAATGVNPLTAFAGQWTTERGARRVLARHGGMAAAIGTVMDEVSPTMAQRGDVAMTEQGALMLLEGATLVGPADEGLKRAPRAHAVRTWRVRCLKP